MYIHYYMSWLVSVEPRLDVALPAESGVVLMTELRILTKVITVITLKHTNNDNIMISSNSTINSNSTMNSHNSSNDNDNNSDNALPSCSPGGPFGAGPRHT